MFASLLFHHRFKTSLARSAAAPGSFGKADVRLREAIMSLESADAKEWSKEWRIRGGHR